MQDLEHAFKDKNVLIIGDVMIDRYLTGKVDRISPEAPVPVVALKKEENRLGGAANVALNVKSLGANPIIVSVVGKEKEGTLFYKLLADNNISTKGIIPLNDRPTTVKTRVIAGGQHLLRIDKEIKHDINKVTTDLLIDKAKAIITDTTIDTILFQDYNKGVLTPQLITSIIQLAKQHGISTVVDPKFHHFFEYQGVDLFKPNLKEIQQVTPFEVTTDLETLTKAALFIEEKLGNKTTMITLSEHGIFYKTGLKTAIVPTCPREIADVCGAGDAVISVAALGVACQLSTEIIAQISNIAGGLVCEEIGVVPVDIKKITEELK